MVAEMIPYGRQSIDDDDIAAVVRVLKSDWLTTGPEIAALESDFARFCGAAEAVAVSSGTAALHAAYHALGLGPGDEVIVPALTFAATANAAAYLGATPVFCDIEADTLLIDPQDAERRITPRTKAIAAVDYAGQPCDYEALGRICARHGLALIADACHAVGGAERGRPVGTLADLSTFSLHPVKHFTSGEGGLVTTEDPELARRMRRFRNHGITTDHRQRAAAGSFAYDMVELGFNYRLTDLQCALARSQLRKLPRWVERRREIARHYDAAFAGLPGVTVPRVRPEAQHAYHLYPLRFDAAFLGRDRDGIFAELRERGIGTAVHYRPVYLHSFYRRRFDTAPGLCPNAEHVYQELLSIPMFSAMTDAEISTVIHAVTAAAGRR
jgi:perosamine synthetase